MLYISRPKGLHSDKSSHSRSDKSAEDPASQHQHGNKVAAHHIHHSPSSCPRREQTIGIYFTLTFK